VRAVAETIGSQTRTLRVVPTGDEVRTDDSSECHHDRGSEAAPHPGGAAARRYGPAVALGRELVARWDPIGHGRSLGSRGSRAGAAR